MNKIRNWSHSFTIVESALLAILILIGYGSTLRVFFLSDDFVLLTAAQLTRSIQAIFVVDPNWFFYRPLGALLWFIEYRLFGYHVVLYHAASLGMHWISSMVLVALVRRLVPAAPFLSILAGAMWALFPLDVEAVAWLADQYDLLATMFVLAALLCLLNAWHHGGWRWYVLAWGCYQLGLWSKETAFMLPLLALLLAWCLPQRPHVRQIMRGVAPCIGLLGLNLLQRYITWGNIGGYAGTHIESSSLFWLRITATLSLLLAPLNHLVFAPTVVWIWRILCCGVIVLGIAMRPHWRVLLFASGWLMLTLVPVFGSLPAGTDLQNSRVLYLPAVGFCLMIATLLYALVQHLRPRLQRQALLLAGTLAIVVCIIALRLHIQPWLIAGQQTVHVPQEIHRLIADFPPGSQVQIAGMPDNYKGAYVYRLGLNHAFAHIYQSTFPIEEVDKFPPFTYAHAGNSYQIAFRFDPAIHNWYIASARWVSAPDKALAGGSDWQSWHIAPCGASRDDWTLNVTAQCSGTGGVLMPGATWLDSPPVPLAGTKWLEVQVELSTPADEGGAIQLQWSHSRQSNWANAAKQEINLPHDGTARVYHFFVQPDNSQQPVHALRLSGVRTTHPIVIHAVAVRQIP